MSASLYQHRIMLENKIQQSTQANVFSNKQMNYQIQQDKESVLAGNNRSRLLKYYDQLKLHKLKIKELYGHLKTFIQPQRQNILSKLVEVHHQMLNLNNKLSSQTSRTIENQAQFHKLNLQKQQSQKLLSDLIHNNQLLFITIQQNLQQKSNLQRTKNQLQLIKRQKLATLSASQCIYLKDAQESNLQMDLKTLSQEFTSLPQNSHINFTAYDLQIQTLDKFVMNAKIHAQQLKDCLSTRFQYLIKLQQNKRDKQAKLSSFQEQNHLLQQKIKSFQCSLAILEQEKQKAAYQAGQEEIILCQVQMENIELKARLEILQHSLTDLIRKENQSKNIIKDKKVSTQHVKIAEAQTQAFYQKLIALKLESEYVENKIISSFMQ